MLYKTHTIEKKTTFIGSSVFFLLNIFPAGVDLDVFPQVFCIVVQFPELSLSVGYTGSSRSCTILDFFLPLPTISMILNNIAVDILELIATSVFRSLEEVTQNFRKIERGCHS